MLIYQLIVKKAGQQIYSHDIPMDKDVPFSPVVKDAIDVFLRTFPDTLLSDDDIWMSITRKP